MGISLLAHSSGTNKQKLLKNTDAEDMSHARLSPLLLTTKTLKKEKRPTRTSALTHTIFYPFAPSLFFVILRKKET
jgi:hypothetical protein